MEHAYRAICCEGEVQLRELEVRLRKMTDAHWEYLPEQFYEGQHAEMIAQVKLGIRAIEEARMRLQKAVIYAREADSVYENV